MDAKALWRFRSGRMRLERKTPALAAHAVGMVRRTAYTWRAVLDEGGIDALRTMPRCGRPARLQQQQCKPWAELTEHLR